MPPSADDLRIFSAVARSGRLVRAAEMLGMQHTTVSRRISRLEDELGQRLFDRGADGWTLTTEGKLLLVPAEAVDDAMRDFEDMFAGKDGPHAGTVRIICPDAFGTYLLAPALGRLAQGRTGPGIELFTTTQSIDTRLKEYDITITMERPRTTNVTSWHLSEYRVGIYASEAYLARARPIRTLADLTSHTNIGFVDRTMDVVPLQRLQQSLPKTPEIQCQNLTLQVEAIAGGAGIGTLPVFMERIEPRLRRILPDEEFRRDYWITVANTPHRLGRIQRVVRLITELIEENKEWLQGPNPQPQPAD